MDVDGCGRAVTLRKSWRVAGVLLAIAMKPPGFVARM
jgi:hypothetical protein